MNLAAIFGIIIISTVVSLVLKKHMPEYSFIINIAAGVIILAFLIYSFLPVLDKVQNLFSFTKIPNEYINILFKALGISFVAQFAADSCKDADETSMAAKIEIAGKIAIVLAALPLFEKITETVLKLI